LSAALTLDDRLIGRLRAPTSASRAVSAVAEPRRTVASELFDYVKCVKDNYLTIKTIVAAVLMESAQICIPPSSTGSVRSPLMYLEWMDIF